MAAFTNHRSFISWYLRHLDSYESVKIEHRQVVDGGTEEMTTMLVINSQ